MNTWKEAHIAFDTSFLGGATTVVVGQRTDAEPPRLVGAVHEYAVSAMIPNHTKNEILAFLYRVLRFLMKNVHEGDSFLLARHYSQRHHKDVLNLYRLASRNDPDLTFITKRMLKQLNFTF